MTNGNINIRGRCTGCSCGSHQRIDREFVRLHGHVCALAFRHGHSVAHRLRAVLIQVIDLQLGGLTVQQRGIALHIEAHIHTVSLGLHLFTGRVIEADVKCRHRCVVLHILRRIRQHLAHRVQKLQIRVRSLLGVAEKMCKETVDLIPKGHLFLDRDNVDGNFILEEGTPRRGNIHRNTVIGHAAGDHGLVFLHHNSPGLGLGFIGDLHLRLLRRFLGVLRRAVRRVVIERQCLAAKIDALLRTIGHVTASGLIRRLFRIHRLLSLFRLLRLLRIHGLFRIYEQGLQAIRRTIKSCGWSEEDPLFKTMIKGLEEKS